MCMCAEQEAEEGTMKWPSKDPCPWTSEEKRCNNKDKVGMLNTATTSFQPVPQFGGRTVQIYWKEEEEETGLSFNTSERMCLTYLLYINDIDYKEVILNFSFFTCLLLQGGWKTQCVLQSFQQFQIRAINSDWTQENKLKQLTESCICDQCKRQTILLCIVLVINVFG